MVQSFVYVPIGTKCFVNARNGWYVTYIKRKTKTRVFTCRNKTSPETSWYLSTGSQVGTDKYTFNYLEVFSEKHEIIVKQNLLESKVYELLESLLENYKKIDEAGLAVLKCIELK